MYAWEEAIFGQAVNWWSIPEKPPSVTCDIVAPLSYGLTRRHVTFGTAAAMQEAIEYMRENPTTKIVFGCCTHCFPGSEEKEYEEKLAMLVQGGISLDRVIYAGGIRNTKTEARSSYEAIINANARRRRIYVITGRTHMRTAAYVWAKEFPVSGIYFSYFSASYEFQKDHTLFLQRGPWRWLIARMLCHVMLRIEDFLGVDIVSKIKHPTWGSKQ